MEIKETGVHPQYSQVDVENALATLNKKLLKPLPEGSRHAYALYAKSDFTASLVSFDPQEVAVEYAKLKFQCDLAGSNPRDRNNMRYLRVKRIAVIEIEGSFYKLGVWPLKFQQSTSAEIHDIDFSKVTVS
jgi:hypothetical protein